MARRVLSRKITCAQRSLFLNNPRAIASVLFFIMHKCKCLFYLKHDKQWNVVIKSVMKS